MTCHVQVTELAMLEAGACPRLPLPGSSGLQQCLTDVRTERDATKARHFASGLAPVR